MGTRGFVGFVVDGQEKIGYNHWDSYPGGLGLSVLTWLRSAVADVDRLTAKVRELRVVSDDETPTDEDIERLAEFYNGNVDGQFARPTWPILGPEVDQAGAEWAERLSGQWWRGIRETDVLGVHEARESDDERHLCPLQLPVIERAVRLWSNPGEVVLSPFAGIGSEGVGALRHGRRFVGVELKPSYYRVSVRNLRAAELGRHEGTLLDGLTDAVATR